MEEWEKEWERIATLKPGPILDELVAERVMGLKKGVDYGEWEEHDWERDKDGKVNNYAWEDDFGDHFGPQCKRCGYRYCTCCVQVGTDQVEERCVVYPPHYSTFLIHAWRVVERIVQSHALSIASRPGGWVVGVGIPPIPPNGGWARGKTIEEAICKAALLAAHSSARAAYFSKEETT